MSTQIENNNAPRSEEYEIDLIALIRQVWSKRKVVILITSAFIVLGLLTAIFSSKEYTASCTIVPQTSKGNTNTSMSRLASLAGINMGNLNSGEQVLSPLVYPNIVNSTSFRQELLQTQIKINGEPEPISLLSYLTDEKYKKFSLIGTIMKYTIGLPGLILQAVKNKPEETQYRQINDAVIVLTEEERNAVNRLKPLINTTIEDKKGYITLLVRMPEAYAAAQVAESTQTLLQKYITKFKIDKVQNNLDFIQERYDELKKEYEDVQMQRARYKDAHMNISTSRARSEQERLDNQYNMAYTIFSEIATQLEQAKIQVKETTPILTVIDPIVVPFKPTKPRKMIILLGFTFLGLCVGCGYVLIPSFIRGTFVE